MLLVAFAFASAPAFAFQGKLKVVGGDDTLEGILTGASLVLTAEKEGNKNPQDILAAAQADYGRLIGALYQEGYYGPVIQITIDGQEAATLPPLTRLPNVSKVVISVDPGPRFKLGRAEITPVTKKTRLPEGFQRGEPARTDVIRDAALAGVDGWREKGHAKADVIEQDVVADHARSRLDVLLRLNPGPLVRFGDLVVDGESAVRQDRIQDIAGIPSGEVFDPDVLVKSAARLRRTGTFSSVTLREADTLDANNQMDVELSLVDAKPRRFGFGAELHSAEGLELSAFWMHRNMFGGAERFRIEGSVGGIGGETEGLDYHLSASLTRPATFTSDTDLFIRLNLDQLEEPTYYSQQASLEVGLTRQFTDELSAEAGIAYRYSDVDDDLGRRQFNHLSFPLSATWDRRNNGLDATKGSYLRADLMPYVGLGGSASGGRVYVDGRIYKGLGEERKVVLAARAQLGSVFGSSIKDTPPDLLFLSGGSGTVRGHSYQSLAIDDGTDETGGRSFVGLSGEVRTTFTDKIGAVAFYDLGYIGANGFVDDTGGWHSGAGLGLRYQTGIGPIRFDVATPVTGPDSSAVQIYLGIGQAF
ncbi:autotransporter assembly complex protein TamA [Tropicibacter oceani]|uniref:Autotransporter assembly complex family protein n=1 Tax=Tropicibacter oceani TaxID=3058420 RepID=A0ABY8QHY8_9RHOB|nr:autotransporter assembly complex family protein [Tropicibacter oceani]WGW03616.1 autotransporter assembly complex family protein [Tropicibacter oceani]